MWTLFASARDCKRRPRLRVADRQTRSRSPLRIGGEGRRGCRLRYLERIEAGAPLLLDRILDEGRVLVDRDGQWRRLKERRPADLRPLGTDEGESAMSVLARPQRRQRQSPTWAKGVDGAALRAELAITAADIF
jgi:hypothetical protein